MLEQSKVQDLLTTHKARLSKLGYSENESNTLSAILLEMFLYQRDNFVKPTLRDVESSNYGWYVQCDSEPQLYLHKDGELHYTTEYAGEWTGYFKTEQEALDAKSKYESK